MWSSVSLYIISCLLIVCFIIVTSVNISVNNNSICIQCYYIDKTTKLGCQLDLVNDTKVLYRVQLLKNSTTNKANDCIVNISSGYYDLYTYDINENSTINTVPIDIKYQVFVPTELILPSSTTTTTTILPSCKYYCVTDNYIYFILAQTNISSTPTLIIIISATLSVIIVVSIIVAVVIIIIIKIIKRSQQSIYIYSVYVQLICIMSQYRCQ